MTSGLRYDLATVDVLLRRDLTRFFRQPSRLAGALGQPIIFWLVIGSGMAATFRMPGSPQGYLQFFYPGVVLMVVLFAAIFTTVSVIEDRHAGFLQAVLAGPGSRAALGLAALALAALGFAVAWAVDNVQGYHAIQMTLLVPLWVVSGAMFPASPEHPVFSAVMRANPVAYAVSATRRALEGPGAPGVLPGSAATDLLVLALFAAVALGLAALAARRRRGAR